MTPRDLRPAYQDIRYGLLNNDITHGQQSEASFNMRHWFLLNTSQLVRTDRLDLNTVDWKTMSSLHYAALENFD